MYLPESPKQPNWFKDKSLQLLEQQLARQVYPGYPAQSKRLFLDDAALEYFQPVNLPLGTWETSDGIVPTIPEKNQLRANGHHRLDDDGRPLHPWFDQMIINPRIGVVTGKGAYWNWGPNYTADPIVVRRDLGEPHILLIERSDNTGWALPGGFVDSGEDVVDAAIREACEETGLDLRLFNPLTSITYQGPVADLRVTAHAWAETTAVLFELPDALAAYMSEHRWKGSDDARTAAWIPISEMSDRLFGSHKLLIEQAVQV